MIGIVLGLGWGDEGKGHTVAALAKKLDATSVVRWSGGPQAAHRVVEKGAPHIFAQFGSGTATQPNCKTFLTSQMVIEPRSLMLEAKTHQLNGLGDVLNRLFIDPLCPITTPYHVIMNKAREIDRGPDGRMGTVGRGVGEVMYDLTHQPSILIRAVDLLNTNPDWLLGKLWDLFSYKQKQIDSELITAEARDWAREVFPNPEKLAVEYQATGLTALHIRGDFHDLLYEEFRTGVVLLEGAQGTLLDPVVGSVPNVTKSRTVLSHAQSLLLQYGYGEDFSVGVLRPYAHRHGRGVLPTEDSDLTRARPDASNETNEWQGGWRCGYFDAVLTKYAVERNPGLSHLVVTNMDRVPEPFYAREEGAPFEDKTVKPISWPVLDYIPQVCGLPLLGVSAGEEGAWAWHDEVPLCED